MLAIVLGLGLSTSGLYASPAAPKASAFTTPIPFTLTDTNGKPQTLAAQHGHLVVLFFFCGCNWCAAVGKQWGQLQHQGALTPAKGQAQPITMVVYSGDVDSVRSFASDSGLDLKQTILLPDPTMKVTLEYQSDTCPRVFVIHPTGLIAYTNDHKDDQPRKAPAEVIADLALSSVRACSVSTAISSTSPK